MKILIPNDKDFNYYQCEILYKKIKKYMNNDCSFSEIVKNSHFYSFYDDENNFIGCIYVSKEGEKLYLNGFSKRKAHQFNIEAVKKVLTFYNCAIFAKTKNRTAEILLKKCGFKLLFVTASGIKYLKKEI